MGLPLHDMGVMRPPTSLVGRVKWKAVGSQLPSTMAPGRLFFTQREAKAQRRQVTSLKPPSSRGGARTQTQMCWVPEPKPQTTGPADPRAPWVPASVPSSHFSVVCALLLFLAAMSHWLSLASNLREALHSLWDPHQWRALQPPRTLHIPQSPALTCSASVLCSCCCHT